MSPASHLPPFAVGRDLAAELEKYADLIIRVGLNVQPDQTVYIGSVSSPTQLDCADFARLLVRKAYAAGARKVHVFWGDDETNKIGLVHAPLEGLGEVTPGLVRWFEEEAEQNAAFAYLFAPNPTLLADVDPERVGVARKAGATALAGFMRWTGSMAANWCIAGHPRAGWAKTVHPDLPVDKAIERLWWEVLHTARVLTDDPVAEWQAHTARLKARTTYLNERRFAKLHFRAPGTDLVVGLPAGHLWQGGADANTRTGVVFAANIPTEEVFCAPLRTEVDGTVTATMPLNLGGVLVEGLRLTVADGRVVDFDADSGREAFAKVLETDEGARYFGEVALVSADSPIAELGTLFYNTLYDENAACHLAIGRAYPINLEGGTELSQEEQVARGLNYSATHIDFMIGSRQLDVDGITAAGEVVPLLRAGLWVAE